MLQEVPKSNTETRSEQRLLGKWYPQTCLTQGCRRSRVGEKVQLHSEVRRVCSHCSSIWLLFVLYVFFNPLAFSLFLSYFLLYYFFSVFSACSFVPPFCLFLWGGDISLDAGWESRVGVLIPASVSAGLVPVLTAGP